MALVVMWSVTTFAVEMPNIIVIIADDLGYGDVSCYGANVVQTPAIDQLAREGVRFTNGYCSASTCTPTRFSLITGTYAFRQKGTGIAPPNGPAIIKPGTETLPSILKRAGYATAAIGKWHLGLGDRAPNWNGELRPGPLEVGFDHSFLLPTTNEVVCTIDLAASLAVLTGQALAANSCLDCLNVLNAPLGKPNAKGRESLLQQDNGGGNFGLRVGSWRLVRLEKRGKPQALVSKDEPQLPAAHYTLYNLDDDPGKRPMTEVVIPDECQSMPRTQRNA